MNKANNPLVSIVTPVYNGDKYLELCIRSVLKQTYQHWEYIIVNNYSTDRTLDIVRKYANKDNRIRMYNTKALLPIMKNWNFSLRCMSPQSKYCKVLHADDLLFSQCLEKMVAVAERHPSVGVVGSYVLSGKRVVCRGLPINIDFLPGRELCRLNLLNQVNCFWSPTSLMIRSDLIRKRPKYYNENKMHADVQACYETLKESDFGFVHKILTFVRIHDDSLTSTAAAPYNRFITDNLDHLLKFGPHFLSPSEYRRHLRLKTKHYYRFLANSFFQLREMKFWRNHFRTLGETGVKIQILKLVYAVMARMILKPFDSGLLLLRSAKQRLF